MSQSDPQFASTDRAAGNFLRLTAASPALDRGTGGFYAAGQLDRAGNAAVSGAAVDLGAYELFWTRATRVGRTATRLSASAPDTTFIPTS